MDHTLVEHRNGTSWSIVPTPTIPGAGYFRGITAVAPNNLWAVGAFTASDGHQHPLTEHWNGTTWVIIPSPGVVSNDNSLIEVSGVGPHDVWTVGDTFYGGPPPYVNFKSLIEHWDGRSWRIVPSPNGTNHTVLYGIKAISGTLAWTVGEYSPSAQGYPIYTLAERWDGTAWTIVSTLNNTTRGDQLFSVSATRPQDVWASGTSRMSGPSTWDFVVEHWDGTSWSIVPKPLVTTSANYYTNVVDAISPTDVFVTDTFFDASLRQIPHPAFEHYHC